MAKYKKRADGRYATNISLGYHENGKPKVKKIYAKTIRELETKAAELKAQIEKGIVIDDKNLTLGEWLDRWLAVYKTQRSYNTVQMYKNAIEKHIKPRIGTVKLSQLRKSLLQDCINSVGDHRRTAEIIQLTLKQSLAYAVDDDYIAKNTAENLQLPKKIKKEKEPLTPDEEQRLKNTELSLKDKAMVMTMLCCGLRKGELLALSPKDIDLEERTININKAVIFKVNTPEIKNTPKTDSSVRVVPIPDCLVQILTEYMKQLDCTEILFPQMDNKLCSQSSFSRFWRRVSKAADLPSTVTAHTLRHTYCVKLCYGGVNVKTAQKLMGHASIKMTMDVYNHCMESQEDILSQINDIF